ncbi:MAG: hypothetical protein LBR50_07135 [Tannerella sp.]|jgi:hypothetical protein|nr:hypothetical protein [Tannerella sp.]
MFLTALISLIILAFCIVLMSVGIILKKGGKFPGGHVGDIPALREKGIHCAATQDRMAAAQKTLFERMITQ